VGSLGQRAGALRASGCAAADERGRSVRENGAHERAAALLGCWLLGRSGWAERGEGKERDWAACGICWAGEKKEAGLGWALLG